MRGHKRKTEDHQSKNTNGQYIHGKTFNSASNYGNTNETFFLPLKLENIKTIDNFLGL